jgi:predicted transporter
MKKKMIRSAMILAGLLLVVTAFILYQHSYDMTEKKVSIETPRGTLSGTLAMPKEYSGKLGLVVFVHGDSAINATYEAIMGKIRIRGTRLFVPK